MDVDHHYNRVPSQISASLKCIGPDGQALVVNNEFPLSVFCQFCSTRWWSKLGKLRFGFGMLEADAVHRQIAEVFYFHSVNLLL
jgi:hypothetical protein